MTGALGERNLTKRKHGRSIVTKDEQEETMMIASGTATVEKIARSRTNVMQKRVHDINEKRNSPKLQTQKAKNVGNEQLPLDSRL